MGFFKDLHALGKIGREAQDRMDVGASMAAMQQSITQASQVMAAAAPPALDPALEAQRVPTTATVVDARQQPMMIGINAVVEIDLHVALPGGIPLPVTRTEQLNPLLLARVVPGAVLQASVVPGRPDSVRLEWQG
ncbi:hypothetical protein [Leucobacter ruminantium]|uniref:Uncharacterized protein n=1 Tax=Leucobacter ruminantium TaxID=1289170 RepID=A0A939S0H6_9MICO|nr:hypothetical protein [Leucobacter ruminantium]MBO1806529.1 hypothetical protein [Leucobacter ruminantium]